MKRALARGQRGLGIATALFVITVMALLAVLGLMTTKFPHFLLGKRRDTRIMTLKWIVTDVATSISRHF